MRRGWASTISGVVFWAYIIACFWLTFPPFEWSTVVGQMEPIWHRASAMSDPVGRIVACGLVICFGLVMFIGIMAALLGWLVLALGILLIQGTYQGMVWLANVSLGGAILVSVVLGAGLIAFVYTHWDPIIEWIARIVLVIISCFGLAAKGHTLRTFHPITRLGAAGLFCGASLLFIAVWQRAPLLLLTLRERLPIEKEYIITAPVDRWSDTIYQPASQFNGKLKRMVLDGRVAAQDDQGRCLIAGTSGFEDKTYRHWPNTVRFKSLTGQPVNVHLFSTLPITTIHEPSRPNTPLPACLPVQNGRPAARAPREIPLDNTVYRVGGDVSAPVVISKVEPGYSEEAREAKIQGTVVIECEIDKHGKVTNARVTNSLGYGLDAKALEALAKWRLTPGLKAGRPVIVGVRIEVNFRLS